MEDDYPKFLLAQVHKLSTSPPTTELSSPSVHLSADDTPNSNSA
jgi:hypothetical protein